MPKKGIHPVVQSVTYVLKNGASVQLPSILQRAVPYTLQSVSALQFEQIQPPTSLLRALQADLTCWYSFQDPTSNPLWTGEKKTLSVATGQSAKMMRRYEKMGFKFNPDQDEPAVQKPAQQPGQRR